MTTLENNTQHQIDDVRIRELKELAPPAHLLREFPATAKATETVFETRRAIHRILHGMDNRLLAIFGPCSIHDVKAAKEYAGRLLEVKERLKDDVLVVMRVYFEKPRTTVGWKGLINDPNLDDSYNINQGLRVARELMVSLNEMGVPSGCEFLDMITPQYMADLVSWGAIGARTTESQIHRELVSGLSCPVGFKNGTSGNVGIAIEAVQSAAHPHTFLGHTKYGQSAIFFTKGNPDCHVILRGGPRSTNYDSASIAQTCSFLEQSGLAQRVMIDCSHANSEKDHNRQVAVAEDIAAQIAAGER